MSTETPGPHLTRSPRRASLRWLGGVLTLACALTTGMLVASAVPAAAATGTWSATAAVLPANADPGGTSDLVVTSCPAPGNCVAAGEYTTGGNPAGFADTQSGGSWTATRTPLPGNANPTVDAPPTGLRCTAVGSCIAVGTYQDTGGATQGYVLTLAGGAWTVTEAPVPSGANANPGVTITALACPAPGSCAAVGTYRDAGSHVQGLLLTETSGAWSATEAPLPAGANANPGVTLYTVSCGGVGSCVAVGSYVDAGANTQALALFLSGGTWTPTEAPLPSDAGSSPNAVLIGASCAGVGSCILVGRYADASSQSHAMAESVAGGVLTVTRAPVPGDAKTSGASPAPSSILLAVSCPSVQYCVAVGQYVAQSSTATGTAPLIDTLSGGAWTSTAAPGSFDPAVGHLLVGVSCSWPGSCAAVGISTGGPTGFIEALTGGTWVESSAILPSDAVVPNQSEFGLGELAGNAVSCVAGTCTASGTYRGVAAFSGFVDTFPNLTGYQLVASDGGLFAFNAPFLGSMGGTHLNQPVVGMAAVPDSGGYYEVASDGGLFSFGAPFFGSMGGQHLNQPIVGIAFDSRTGGYYEVASDGGIFAFNAPFLGSMGGQHLNKPIVGIAFDGATGGYYEVASDGGLFAFGAPFQGSMGGPPLNKPIVGMTYDSTTGGYYEVASDGGLFSFGAPFQGSMGGAPLNKPIVGMAYDFATGGYYEVASDGGIFSFGAPFQGSMGGTPLNKPIVGMAFG